MLETELITSIRIRVSDTAEPPIYADAVYQNCIRGAVAWVNIRARVSPPIAYTAGALPSGLELVTSPYDHFIYLKAVEEMARIRGSERAAVAGGSASRSEIELPNLRIEKDYRNNDSAGYWSDIAAAAMEELLGLLEQMPETEAKVTSHTTVRRSIVTGGMLLRELDAPLPPVTLSGVALGDSRFTLNWTKCASVYFNAYIVESSTYADMRDPVQVVMYGDNHKVSVTARVSSMGVKYFRVTLRNGNGLTSASNVFMLEVT